MSRQKSRFSLRLKISAMIAFLVLLFGALVIVVVGQLVTKALLESKKETIEGRLTEQVHESNAKLVAVQDGLNAFVKLPELEKYLSQKNPKLQDERLLDMLTHLSLGRYLDSLYIVNTRGVTLVSTDKTFVGQNFSYRNYVKKALLGETYTEMAVGSVTKKPGFYFSAPITDVRGEVVGVLAAKLNANFIFEDLDRSTAGKQGSVMFVNRDGVVMYSTKPSFMYKSLAPLSEETLRDISVEKRYADINISSLDYKEAMEYILGGEKEVSVGTIYDDHDSREEIVGVQRIGELPYYLISESDEDSILATVMNIVRVVSGIILIALILGTAVQVLYLRLALRPLEQLEKYAANVASGKLDENLIVRSNDELESLSESVANMVKSIRENYANLEKEVRLKTEDLSAALTKLEGSNVDLENTKKAILNVMEDLGEERDSIEAERNRVETILKSIGDSVFVTDIDGKLIMANQAAEKMTGVGILEMLGKKYTEVFHFVDEDNSESEYPDFVGEAMQQNTVGSLLPHTIIVSKEGVRIPVLDSAAPLRDLEGKVFGCVVVVRDNTKERELEKSKDDFLSVASHQLRTPLGSMRWSLEMILGGDAGDQNEETKELIKQVYEGNMRMIGLVNDLLNVSRIDQGRVMDEPTDTTLNDVVLDVVKEIASISKEKQVSISTDIENDLPKVHLDPKRFREVIENLVSNAVKYNVTNGKVEIKIHKEDKNIKIMINDTGIGIPKKDQSKLFDKFFRADNAVHSETEGSGLGLYVVKKFVEGWGGILKVESELGKGSSFTILLPTDISQNIEKNNSYDK